MRFLFNLIGSVIILFAVSGCTAEAKKGRLAKKADRYYAAGEYDKAKIEYLNVLRLDQTDVTAMERLGIIWFDQGAPLPAFPFLRRACELNPNNPEVRARFALCYAAIGRFAEARTEATTVLRQAPGNIEASVLLGEAVFSNEEVAATEQLLKELVEANSVAFHCAIGALALRKGDAAASKAALEKALEIDPKSSYVHASLGKLYLVQKEQKKAEEAFRTAAELAPPRAVARLRYAEFLSQAGSIDAAKSFLTEMSKSTPDYLPAWRLLAQLASVQKNYDEALALLENIFSRDSNNLEARILQTQIWLAKGEAQRAVDGLLSLDRTYDSNLPLIKYYLGRAYLENKNPPQAAAALSQAIAITPDYPEAVLLLAEVNLREGKPDAVIPAMTGLLKKFPKLGQAQMLLVSAYDAAGQYGNAAAIVRQQIENSPKSAEPYFALGTILRKEGKIAEARSAFHQAAEAAPGNFAPIHQLIEMDIEAKQFDAASQKIREQLGKNPNLAGAHFLMGKVHATQRQWSEAAAALEKTLELDANFPGAYDLLLTVYILNDQLPQAIDRLKTLLAKEPSNIAALMLMAGIHEKRGDFAKSQEVYETVLALRPDSPAAQNNLAYLYAEELNQLDKAHEFARKARIAQPDNPAIADTLGWILYKRADYQQALALLRESALKLKDHPQVQFHFGMASYMMGQAESARTALQQAAASPASFRGKDDIQRRLIVLDEKPEELSIEKLQKLLGEDPGDVIAALRLGQAFEQKGDLQNAVPAYEQALKANPKLAVATTKLAQLYAGPLQNREKALEYAKNARELAPNDPLAAGILGRLTFESGSFAPAYSLLQESAQALPENDQVVYDYAWAAYSVGRLGEAEEAMQRVAAKGGARAADAARFVRLVGLAEKPGEIAASEAEIQKTLAENADYVPALMVAAQLDAQRGEKAKAEARYRQVQSRFPDFAPAQKRLAALLMDDPERNSEAFELAMKARKTFPDDLELSQTLARINYHRKQYRSAVQLFQDSARERPLDADNLFYLGMSQLQTNQKKEARETLERAIAAGLAEPRAGEAKQRITELDSDKESKK